MMDRAGNGIIRVLDNVCAPVEGMRLPFSQFWQPTDRLMGYVRNVDAIGYY